MEVYTIDAKNKILGRVATEAVRILSGKHNPAYEPHITSQHKVAIINAVHVRVTGTKRQTKMYKHFSGYPGGLKEISFDIQFQRDPRKVLLNAIRRMLPKNKLRAIMLRNLTIHVNE